MAIFIRDFSKMLTFLFYKESRLLALAVWVVVISNFLSPNSLQAQVSIPREGFPYCQPFTGTGPFDYTILGGEIRIPVGVPENLTSSTIIAPFSANPNGTSLQLTPYDYWHSGYAVVDIPFSSQFGIKTSFEYFSYGIPDARGAADGISFFMFDADQPLDLGYLGGSLAYAPYIDLDGSVLEPGISGGYVGIGFDEWGNFGVGQVGQPISNWDPRISNSITVRGPQSLNYDVYERYVTKKVNAFGTDYFPPPPLDANPIKWFDIDDDGLTRTTDCFVAGYRKVFIELIPFGSGYQIKIDMLVNTSANGQQLVTFPLIDYPYNAPDRLKIGFAGSTGYGKNNHEIRNVTVNVADISEALLPEVSEQNKVICIDEDLEFTFPVVLQAGNDAFITCMQLFQASPGAPNNTIPPTNYSCGFDQSLCVTKCDPANYTVPVYDAGGNIIGTFFSILEDLNTGNFEDIKNKATIRFEPAPGFVGEATVYYNVTDNYGLTSEPAKITVVANPFPIKIQDAKIEIPSCDGQDDGRIFDVIVGDLESGFDYEWLYNGSSIGKSGATVSSLVGGEATFELAGVNLGTHTLNVWNPSNNLMGGCYETVTVVVDKEEGTPVDLVTPNKTICEGEKVSFLPSIDPSFNTNGSNPTYVWYQQGNRSGGPIVSGSTITMNGNPIDVEILSSGELILKGLKNYAASSTYEYFVEVGNQSQGGTNFCPYLGDVLTKATATVNPPLNFQVSQTDDWCLANVGEIIGVVTGASDITYSLLDPNDQLLQTNVSGIFSGLSPGDYKVYGTSASLGCSSPVELIAIQGPTAGLSIVTDQVENAYCALPNGTLSFQLYGGNLPYQSITVDGTLLSYEPSGDYFVDGLTSKSYTVVVSDAKGCSTNMSIVVPNDPSSVFSVIGSEVCEGQVATATVDSQNPSTGTPVFIWYLEDGAGGYTEITDGQEIAGVTYQISPTFDLSAIGLVANATPYEVFLQVTGDKICDQGYLPAELKVTPGPEMNSPVTTDACFGESTGSIQAQIPGGNFSDFEFSLIGDNGISLPFSKNDGLFENLLAGNYELNIRSALGCVTTLDSVVIIQPDTPITINTPSRERASCDLANGLIKDLVISGGWGNYSVEWRKGAIDGAIIPGDENSAVDLLPDTYFLIVTDEQGCQEIFDFAVEASSDPVYQLVPTINSCEGEAISIKPIHIAPDPILPPTAYTEVIWYKESGQVGQISNGSVAGEPGVTYTIDDTDWLNPSLLVEGLPAGNHDYYFYVVCTGQEIKADLVVFEIPEVTVNTNPVSCFGSDDGKVMLTPGMSPLYTYSLNGDSPVTQDELEALNLFAGDYDLEILTPAGCPQMITFTVNGPDTALDMTPLVGIDPGCGAPNGKLRTTISGGWAPYTVAVLDPTNPVRSFTTSDSEIEIAGLTSGFYSIEVTDDHNCLISSSTIELVDGPTQIDVEEKRLCEGQAVEFTPNIDPQSSTATYFWYFDAGTSQPINSSPVPASDGNIYEIDSNSGTLTISGLSNAPNPYQYFVIAQGAEVCPGGVGTASVIVYDTPTASSEVTNEVCFGDGGSIKINVSGGSGKYSFSMDGLPDQDSNIFENIPVGIHNVLISTPETCEVLLQTIEITGPQNPLKIVVSEVNSPTCSLSNGEITLQATGGAPNYSIEIIKDGVSMGSTPSNQNGVLIISNIGKGEYEFFVTDAGGCIINLMEPLDLVEVPTIIEADDQQICEGEDALLNAEIPSNISNVKYSWYFDQELTNPVTSSSSNGLTYLVGNSGSLSISGLSSIPNPYRYFVMVEGPGICAVVPKEVQVRVYAYPNLRVSNPSIVCDPEGTVDLTNFIEGYNPQVNDYNILSPLGTALIGNELNAVDESGNYEVSVSSKGSNCWTTPKRILVRIADELLQSNFEYHADQGGGVIISNESVQLLENVDFEDLSLGDVLIWEWDFGDGGSSNEQNPSHIFKAKGTYTVKLKTTDSIGCQSVYSITVEVKDDYLLMMPNAFTPDGSKNHYYKPKHRGISSLDFYVFNTWGELIYNSNSLEDQGWDGIIKGKKAPNGNYVYKVKYQTRSGNALEQSGVFILIR